MRVIVDLTRCEGYAQCAFLAPDVFKMQAGDALVYEPNPDDELREKILRAAAACPVQAIYIGGMGVLRASPREDGPSRAPAAIVRRAPSETAFRRTGRIVIVGASLAGLRAALALRREGFAGSLTIIGDEPCAPYDRPPLSKQVLSGWVTADHTELPAYEEVDAQWRLGTRAVALELAAKEVVLANGERVGFDRLLVATGSRARPWPNDREASLDGVEALRTRDDAHRLQRLLSERRGRVLVIGAGFTGSEVASVCRELEHPVTVVERGASPLVGALGGVIGNVAAQMQRDHGVDLRCGVTVTSLEGDDRGRLRRAHLSDGSSLEVAVAVVALGSIRNVEWLRGSGLAAGTWGITCDAGCRAVDVNGLLTDDIFVAGDVARFPHPVYDYEFLAIEHWGNAVTQAEIAAHNMLSTETDRWPHLATPSFWSTQFGTSIKSVGVPTFSDEVVITQGSLAERRFIAVYGRKGRVTAAVAFDHSKWLPFYEALLDAAAPFPPLSRTVDHPVVGRPVPSEIPERGVPTHGATVVVTGRAPYERRVQWEYRHQ